MEFTFVDRFFTDPLAACSDDETSSSFNTLSDDEFDLKSISSSDTVDKTASWASLNFENLGSSTTYLYDIRRLWPQPQLQTVDLGELKIWQLWEEEASPQQQSLGNLNIRTLWPATPRSVSLSDLNLRTLFPSPESSCQSLETLLREENTCRALGLYVPSLLEQARKAVVVKEVQPCLALVPMANKELVKVERQSTPQQLLQFTQAQLQLHQEKICELQVMLDTKTHLLLTLGQELRNLRHDNNSLESANNRLAASNKSIRAQQQYTVAPLRALAFPTSVRPSQREQEIVAERDSLRAEVASLQTELQDALAFAVATEQHRDEVVQDLVTQGFARLVDAAGSTLTLERLPAAADADSSTRWRTVGVSRANARCLDTVTRQCAQLRQLAAREASREAAVEELRAQYTQSEQQMTQLRASLEDSEKKLSDSTAQVTQLQRQLAAERCGGRLVVNAHCRVEHRLQETRSESLLYKHQVSELRQQVSELQEQLTNSRSELSRLETTCTTQGSALELLSGASEELAARHEADLAAARHEVERLRAAEASGTATLGAWRAELEGREEERLELKIQLLELEQDAQHQKMRAVRAERNLDAANKKLQLARREHEASQHTARLEIRELRASLQRMPALESQGTQAQPEGREQATQSTAPAPSQNKVALAVPKADFGSFDPRGAFEAVFTSFLASLPALPGPVSRPLSLPLQMPQLSQLLSSCNKRSWALVPAAAAATTAAPVTEQPKRARLALPAPEEKEVSVQPADASSEGSLSSAQGSNEIVTAGARALRKLSRKERLTAKRRTSKPYSVVGGVQGARRVTKLGTRLSSRPAPSAAALPPRVTTNAESEEAAVATCAPRPASWVDEESVVVPDPGQETLRPRLHQEILQRRINKEISDFSSSRPLMPSSAVTEQELLQSWAESQPVVSTCLSEAEHKATQAFKPRPLALVALQPDPRSLAAPRPRPTLADPITDVPAATVTMVNEKKVVQSKMTSFFTKKPGVAVPEAAVVVATCAPRPVGWVDEAPVVEPTSVLGLCARIPAAQLASEQASSSSADSTLLQWELALEDKKACPSTPAVNKSKPAATRSSNSKRSGSKNTAVTSTNGSTTSLRRHNKGGKRGATNSTKALLKE